MKKVVGKGERDTNGKDKNNKTNLMMQLSLTFIPWYVQFVRLVTYKYDRREYIVKLYLNPFLVGVINYRSHGSHIIKERSHKILKLK